MTNIWLSMWVDDTDADRQQTIWRLEMYALFGAGQSKFSFKNSSSFYQLFKDSTYIHLTLVVWQQ